MCRRDTGRFVIDDAQRQIAESNVVVAEISTRNPNVFYELGYAHALRKPTVILVRREKKSDVPFDLRGYRAIYDDSIGGKRPSSGPYEVISKPQDPVG